MRFKVFIKRTVVILLACVLLVTWSAPKADALALEIGVGVIVTAFAAYLATSGITYAASGGDKSDIINSIQSQITPWVESIYGGWDNYIASVKVLANPLSLLNGKLAISKALVDVFARARQWLIDNVFTDSDSVTVDSVTGGTYITYDGLGSAAMYDGTLPSVYDSNYFIVLDTYNYTAGENYYIDVDGLNVQLRIYANVPEYVTSFIVELRPKTSNGSVWSTGPFAYLYYHSGGGYWPVPRYAYFTVATNYKSSGRCAIAGFTSGQLLSDGDAITFKSGDIYDYSMSTNFGDQQWQFVGDLQPSDAYDLTSDYDSTVTPVTVSDGESLTVDTNRPFVAGLDDQLYDVLQGIQEGVGAIAGSVSADAVDVAPAAYLSPADYMLALTDLFPFCLPWDIARGLAIFDADPVAPSVTWDMPLPLGGTYPVTIDLSVLDGVALVLRRLELLASVIGLAYVTRKYLHF